MRVAIVSPYSWTYPGGVNRHVESLAEELMGRGHELRVLAPWDPPDRISRALHRSLPRELEAPGVPDPARPHDRHRRERRGLQPLRVSRRRDEAAPRAARLRPRRRPRARAGAAGSSPPTRSPIATPPSSAPSTPTRPIRCRTWSGSLCGARRVFNQLARPDRCLRGRRLDRPALVRRRVRDDPQRGRPDRRADRGPKPPSDDAARSSSSAGRRSARGCRSCSPPSRPWSSTCPRG